MGTQEENQFKYIDTDDALDELINQIRKVKRIALDTEADSLHHYYAKVCLIQLTINNENFIIDPLSKLDLSSFLKIISDKHLIFHGADYDLRMLRSSFDFRPNKPVFDTMLAAQILGYSEFGFSPLVKMLFNKDLDNLGKKTNWSKRPLTPKQLKYAYEDTHYLVPLAKHLERELIEQKRIEWHKEACERVVQATAIDKPRDIEKAWRIKGVRYLNRRQMAFLHEIWHWRENEAQMVDLPPFKIIGNHTILDIVHWVTSQSHPTLKGGPRLPRNCSGNRLIYLEKAIQKANNLPESEWPEIRKLPRSSSPLPNCKEEVNALLNQSGKIAEKLGIPPSVLATRAAITAIAHNRPTTVKNIMECSPMMQWQAEILLPSIVNILENKK